MNWICELGKNMIKKNKNFILSDFLRTFFRQIVWVLSKDESISGDYGWWTGKIGDKVGIFPANYVTNEDMMLKDAHPNEIKYDDLDVKEVIGAGKFY